MAEQDSQSGVEVEEDEELSEELVTDSDSEEDSTVDAVIDTMQTLDIHSTSIRMEEEETTELSSMTPTKRNVDDDGLKSGRDEGTAGQGKESGEVNTEESGEVNIEESGEEDMDPLESLDNHSHLPFRDDPNHEGVNHLDQNGSDSETDTVVPSMSQTEIRRRVRRGGGGKPGQRLSKRNILKGHGKNRGNNKGASIKYNADW